MVTKNPLRSPIEAVTDYVEQRKREGVRAGEPVYNGTYDSMRSFLRRLGSKVLKKNINPHLFRHSSATYYASKLNRQELCYRYGWAFSSNMPDIYISRAGMQSEKLDEAFTQTELGELKSKLSKEEYERKKTQEEVEELKQFKKNVEQYLNQQSQYIAQTLMQGLKKKDYTKMEKYMKEAEETMEKHGLNEKPSFPQIDWKRVKPASPKSKAPLSPEGTNTSR